MTRRNSHIKTAAQVRRALAPGVPLVVPPDRPAEGVFYRPDGERWSRAWYDWRAEAKKKLTG